MSKKEITWGLWWWAAALLLIALISFPPKGDLDDPARPPASTYEERMREMG